MSYTTGLTWLHHGAGLSDGGDDPYGSTGYILTPSERESDISDNTVVAIDCSNASAVFVKPVIAVSGSNNSTGTTHAEIQVWGSMGFGETSQSEHQENPRLLYKLANVKAATASDGRVAGTSASGIFTNNGGTIFTSCTGAGTGGDDDNAKIFAMIPAMHTSPPLVRNSALVDNHAGFTVITGIDALQELYFNFYIGTIDVDSTGNALVALIY